MCPRLRDSSDTIKAVTPITLSAKASFNGESSVIRHVSLIQAAMVFALILIFGVGPSFSDMIVLGPAETAAAFAPVFAAAFCVTVVVEFVIIYLLLGRPTQSRKWLFVQVLYINLISYPAASIGFFCWSAINYHTAPHTQLFVIEILVVLLEWGLLMRILKTMHRTGRLDAPVGPRSTLKIAFAANFATCLLGLLAGFAVFVGGGIVTVIAVFGAMITIEYSVIYRFLERPAQARAWLFLQVAYVDVISVAAAGFGIIFWSNINHYTPLTLILCAIWLLTALLEWVLLMLVFRTMRRKGKLIEPVRPGRALKIALIANIASSLFKWAACYSLWGMITNEIYRDGLYLVRPFLR
jgi:hypothetical protein